jgi:hypothetical protein
MAKASIHRFVEKVGKTVSIGKTSGADCSPGMT